MEPFRPIANRNQLSKLVAEDIEKAIIDRKFDPGVKLPSESEFCRQFNVSRTAIREAMKTLSARGLIRIEKGKGAFVEEFSSKTVTDPLFLFLEMSLKEEYIIDVIRARQLIEPPVTGLAAKHHTEDDTYALEDNLEKLHKHVDDVEEIARIDMDFHLIIAKASKNELLPLILDPIHRLMPKIKAAILDSVDDARGSAIEWHTKIYHHIVARDEQGAIDAMREHLLNSEEHMQKMLKKVRGKEKSLIETA